MSDQNIGQVMTVGELATADPRATRYFEKYGIDYCCGGNRNLGDACSAAGVSVDDLLREIKTTPESSPLRDYSALGQRQLIDHIVSTHHAFTRQELSRLQELLQKVCSVHGTRHPELITVRSTFRQLTDELIPHMFKEESVLFPYVAALEGVEHGAAPPPPTFVTVRNPIRMMTSEHETAGELLQEIRRFTSGYVTPSDACASYTTLYAALENLEADLHQHIHLENNILFPRAIQHEEIVLRGRS